MSEEKKLTAQEWADMNAEALAKKNKEVLEQMVGMILEAQVDTDINKKLEHWRNVHISSAICSGKTVDEAISIADEVLKKVYDA